MVVKLEDIECSRHQMVYPPHTLNRSNTSTFVTEAYAKITDAYNKHTEHIKKVAVDTILYSLHDRDKSLRWYKIVSDEQCIDDMSCAAIADALYDEEEYFSELSIRNDIWFHMAERYVDTFISFQEISTDITEAIGYCYEMKGELVQQIFCELERHECEDPHCSLSNYIRDELWDKTVSELIHMASENCKDSSLLSFMRSWRFKKIRPDERLCMYESTYMYMPYSECGERGEAL